jgi:hypothetical protein
MRNTQLVERPSGSRHQTRRKTCIRTCVIILLHEPSEDVAAGRRRPPWHHQIVRLVDELHDSVLGHVDGEETLLLLQGEVDQVRVRWAHGRDHGDPPRQPPRHVAVVVPDLLEAHPVRYFPNNGAVVVVVVVNGDRRPHAYRRRRFVLEDDLHVPQGVSARRDAAVVVDAWPARVQSTSLREVVEVQPLHDFIGVGVAAENPPREVEPPESVVVEDHAGGYPVPAVGGQGVVHLLLVPEGSAHEAEVDAGSLAARGDHELGDNGVFDLGPVFVDAGEAGEDDALDVEDDRIHAIARGEALGGGRKHIALLLRWVYIPHQDEVALEWVTVELQAVEGFDGEVDEEADGVGDEDVGVPIWVHGLGVRASIRGDDGDVRRCGDPEGEVGGGGGLRLRILGTRCDAEDAAEEHPRRLHWVGLVAFFSLRAARAERENARTVERERERGG